MILILFQYTYLVEQIKSLKEKYYVSIYQDPECILNNKTLLRLVHVYDLYYKIIQ